MSGRLLRPHSRWGGLVAVLAIGVTMLGLAGVGRSGRATSPRPRAGTGTTAPQPTSGFPLPGSAIASPSTSLDTPPSAPVGAAGPQVVDVTDGAVAETTAQAWGGAYLATLRWTVYAVEREQLEILAALYPPGQADPATARLIVDARSDGAQLSYPSGHEPHPTRLILVALTAAQRVAIGGTTGGAATAYALVVTYTGPTDLSVRWPGGQVQTYAVLPAREQVTELSVGAVVDDPAVGTVWRETYSRDCTAHPDPVLCPY